MNPPSFWAHNGALYMSMKEIAALKWSSSSQSSKKLKGKVLKACDVGLLLSGGGQACDVELSFSVWKRVRSDKQQSMKLGTHKAYVSFCFNGAVPAPQTV